MHYIDGFNELAAIPLREKFHFFLEGMTTKTLLTGSKQLSVSLVVPTGTIHIKRDIFAAPVLQT